MIRRPVLLLIVPALACTMPVHAVAATKPVKPTPKATNTVKGQSQMAGLNGQFGTVYSLKEGLNLSITAAHYTVNGPTTPSQLYPTATDKLLVIEFALKNASPADIWLNSLGLFTAVDQSGQLYTMGDSDVTLKSQGTKSNPTLRPGQGIGQAGTTDPLQAVIKIPASARIVKIMVNRSRLNSSDETIRYYIAGTTKAESGGDGDPKNLISPLPDEVRDPSDSFGALALDEGKGTIGKPVPSRFLMLTVESIAVAPNETTVDGNGPGDGKKFIAATITVSAPSQVNSADFVSPFDWPGGGNITAIGQLVDTDGDKYDQPSMRKSKRDEPLSDGTGVKSGESVTYRLLWSVPKDATLKKLVIGASDARRWAYDVSDVK